MTNRKTKAEYWAKIWKSRIKINLPIKINKKDPTRKTTF